jgi:hypothetical protein
MRYIFRDNIHCLLFLKYHYKKNINSKIVQFKHVKIKTGVIIVLKPNYRGRSEANLRNNDF